MSELQDVFKLYGQKYKDTHKLSLNQHKVSYCIETCRTSAMGGHIDECNKCGYKQISYNSCRNRHCPKYQTLVKERWISDRKKDLLRVQYFHVVFTIPNVINLIALNNQEVIYSILFKSAAQSMTELSQDKKYLGAQIGFTSVLHTWGQNLMFHPHIHCIVPGGGLSGINKWVNSKKKFFIPVKVLSRIFRGKFLYFLKEAFKENKLKFRGEIKNLVFEQDFQSLINKLYGTEWITYCKKPFKGPEQVIEYLGRYTHRVAISNNRILKVEDGKVTFKWKDYKDGNKQKIMTLYAMEFIRRFLLHVLPNGFMRIRHYGILSNCNRATKLKLCKKLTGAQISSVKGDKLSVYELMLKLTGRDITLCTCCQHGKLMRKMDFGKQGISPPVNVA
jgi:hypothetical protein